MSSPLSRFAAARSALFPHVLSWLLLLLAVVMVLGYWQHGVRTQQRDNTRDFERLTGHAVQRFESRFRFYENILYASRGLFDSAAGVTGDQWRGFVQALQVAQNYPGVRYTFFARYEEAPNTVTVAEDMAASDLSRLSAEERGFSMPVTHIEPSENSRGMLGYDLAAEAPTMQALRASCARRQAVMSGVLNDRDGTGLIMRHLLPVFRKGVPLETEAQRHKALRGWVGIEFDVTQWLQVFADEVGQREWVLRVAHEGAPFFSSEAGGSAYSGAAYRHSHDLLLGGKMWRLAFASTEQFEQRRTGHAVHLFALSALLLIFSLWLLFRRLQGRREQAEALAETMTRQLRDSEARYREMFEANKAVELLVNPEDGGIVDANQAAADYYGFSREALKCMSMSDINTLPEDEIKAEMARAVSEKRNHFLFRHRHASGEVRDVEVHAGPVQIGNRQLLYAIVHDVTARMESERALRESEARYHTVIDTTAEGYWMVDLEALRIIEVNDALCRILGYEREAIIGKQPFDFAEGENLEIFEQQVARVHETQQRSYEIELRHKDGHTVNVQVHSTNLPRVKGEPLQAFAFITDISERKRTEEQLRIAATFFETTSEAITVTDTDNRIVAVNPAFSLITGYSEEEVLGKDPSILSANRHSPAFYNNMWQTLQRMGRWQGEIWNRRKNGEVFPEWLSIVAIKNEKGETNQYMAVFSDITKRKRDEEKIWRQANYDALTGLPNRNLFKDRLDRAMHAAHREGTKLALLFIDLDRFKWVNDTMGHAIGDKLLQETANRLSHSIRETDTVARLGGDEFTVILEEIHDSSEVDRIAEKLLHRLAQPFKLDGKEAFISGSIGITLYPGDSADMETLLRNADAAMYEAKEAGRNVFRYFTREMNANAQRRVLLQNELRRVLEREELLLHYQPIVHGDGKVAGAEALVRWHHPSLGFISPDEFIPLAEEIGIIIDIEQWVMRRACHDTVLFQARAGEDFFMSVNVSSMQCKSDQCRLFLGSILKETGIAPSSLKLEITERVMMENTDQVVGLLSEVKSMGVRLAVDDFGTGYSSLSYLKQFPVDVLKVDRVFINGLPGDSDDVALVEAIIAMGRSLSLQVVAEGVETAEQLAFLRSLGCDLLQGYHFSRPMPFEAFCDYLEK